VMPPVHLPVDLTVICECSCGEYVAADSEAAAMDEWQLHCVEAEEEP
jgi:hypothetical protein